MFALAHFVHLVHFDRFHSLLVWKCHRKNVFRRNHFSIWSLINLYFVSWMLFQCKFVKTPQWKLQQISTSYIPLCYFFVIVAKTEYSIWLNCIVVHGLFDHWSIILHLYSVRSTEFTLKLRGGYLTLREANADEHEWRRP